ncbi:phosphotransferase family protein [Pseudothauera rhizosphaerae]|uniref:phosphotransferase family protein n=1 Tax=Pseudothauera rhizosphaerae TaxID=2565932 RepID=UPI001454C5A3|nr:phosphotransferase family protein [Pseudothauera rhizosphaerae]
MSDLAVERVQTYLSKALAAADLRVLSASQFAGGISRDTWGVDVAWTGEDGLPVERGLVLRLDPPISLIKSRRNVEYAMYQVCRDVPGVPVPLMICNEDDPEQIGAPFFAMEKLKGVTSPPAILGPEFEASRQAIMKQMFEILGAIAAARHEGKGLADVVSTPAPGDIWDTELSHWERIIADNHIGHQPITRAAIRYLRRSPPPPPPRVTIVHGDYRIGNFLFTPEGINGILDWELAHLGDPLEDLAWALAKNWRYGHDRSRVASLITPEQAIEYWESTSGYKADRAALHWWTVFTHVKCVALWTTGAHEFMAGTPRGAMHAFPSWLFMNAQELWMIEEIGAIEQ